MPDLTRKDLRARVRRFDELSRLLSIEADLFKSVDVTSDVKLHYSDREEYRAALRDAIRGLGRARMALVDVVQRADPGPPRDGM